jgi:hypothetical protein
MLQVEMEVAMAMVEWMDQVSPSIGKLVVCSRSSSNLISCIKGRRKGSII